MAVKGTCVNSVRQDKFEITPTILIKYFANVKGTIYGNGLSRGTQVKKVWERLL